MEGWPCTECHQGAAKDGSHHSLRRLNTFVLDACADITQNLAWLTTSLNALPPTDSDTAQPSV